jgi:hypothetical protein
VTVEDLISELAAYTEHRDLCPWTHGRPAPDEHGCERPCTCGLRDLLAEAANVTGFNREK